MNAPTIQDDAPDNRKGTGFTNLQKYLGANSGNNLDQYIGGRISNEANNFQNDLNSSQNNFQNDIETQNQNIPKNQTDANNVLASFATPANASTGQTGTGSTAGSLDPATTPGPTSPTDQYNQYLKQYSPSDETASNFQNYMNPTYSGPNGLGKADQLRATAQNLNSVGSNSNPTGLLSRYLGGTNPYTTGQQNFDSMFLGNANNTKQNLSQLRGINPNSVDSMAQADQSAIQGVQGQQKSLADSVRARLGLDSSGQPLAGDASSTGLLPQQQYQIAKQATDARAAQDASYKNLMSIYSAANPNYDQWASASTPFGASGPAAYKGPFTEQVINGQPLKDTGYWGINPGAYIQEGPAATQTTTASPQQLAQLTALQKLAGVTPNNYDTDTLSGIGSYNKATNGINMDTNGFNSALTKAQGDYTSKEKNYLDDINNLLQGRPAIQNIDQNVAQLNLLRAQYGLSPVSSAPFTQGRGGNVQGPVLITPPVGGTPTGGDGSPLL